ncbi:MAG: NAD-dependent epimerase/dehydratase family protein, partial [Planctomycetota bacterium]
FPFYEGSILDGELLRGVFAGADVVLHQAAIVSPQRSIAEPLETHAVNVNGTLGVLQAARECGVKRVVYASTCAVYGDDPALPKREEMTPVPKSPYAASKLSGEHYCRVFHEVYGLGAVALRYFNIYGPHQDPHSEYAAVVPIFIRCLAEGRRPRMFGDGQQSRDFTFVEDVVAANLLAARAPGAEGEVFNVGTGRRHTLTDLLALLQELMGEEVEPEYCEEQVGDVRHSQADIGKACQVLEYEPQVSFEEGLRRTVDWYRGKHATTLFLGKPDGG